MIEEKCFIYIKFCSNTVCIQSFCLNACLSAFLPLSLPCPHSSSTLSMSCSPSGCARVLSGWCHGCVWDDDLWLWSGVRRCSLFSLPPAMSLKWGWGEVCWWMALSSFLWSWHGQTSARTLHSSVITYFKKDIWTLNKKHDLFRRTLDNKYRLNYLNWNFCTVFLSEKTQRSAKCLTLNCTWTYSSAVCESSPWWPCSIAGLAVAVFIAPLCVQSSILF